MNRRILYELYNLSLPTGTGIATYARNLVHSAAGLGYETQGLLNSNGKVHPRDPVLTEVNLLDACNQKLSFARKAAGLALPFLVGAPLGLSTARLSKQRVATITEGVPLTDSYVASLFTDTARLHFKRYGALLNVKVEDRPAIFHATQATPLYVRGAKNIYTIHDLVPMRLPHTTLDDKPYFVKLVRYLGQFADRIVTVSECSRQDLISLAGVPEEKVVNTYQAVALPPSLTDIPHEEVAQLVERSFGLKYKEYFLYYGAIEPKKNVGALVDAYVASGTSRPLIVAGALGWRYESEVRKIRENRSRGYQFDGDLIREDQRIRRLQYLPLFQLVALIRGARALLFPSLYEGFGLPVLEAMLLGTPVLTSSISSLKEVAGDAALLVDPSNVVDIMRGIQQLDSDDALRAALSAKGRVQAEKFSPQAYGERLAKLYEGLLD